jgi:hypothetical protein
MSGVEMTPSNNTTKSARLKRLLKASVAVPVAALMLSPAAAVELVTVDSPVTLGALNGFVLDAMNTPEADITVDIDGDGVVTGSGNVQLIAQGAGLGDGVLRLQNAGQIGTLVVDSTDIADLVGVSAAGGTQFVGTNTGLITGSVNASNFSDGVSFTNGGTVRGGVTLSSIAGVTLASTGAIGSSGATATALSTGKTSTVDGVTTQTISRGAATISVADVGTKAARGSVSASGGTATVDVTGIAGDVTASGTGTTTTVDGKTAAPAAGKTVTTFDRTVTRTGGVAAATIGDKADINSLTVSGANKATASVAGKVANSIDVAAGQVFGTASETATETRNADNATTAFTSVSTNGALVPDADASVTLAATGSAAAVSVLTTGTATVVIDGAVNSAVSVTNNFTGGTFSQASTLDGKGNFLSTSNESVELANAGKMSLAIGAAGKAASVTMNSGGGSITAAIAGKVAGSVNLTASDLLNSSSDSQLFDAKTANLVNSSSAQSSVSQGAKVGLTVAQTGSAGDVTILAGADGATVVVDGTTATLNVQSVQGVFQNKSSQTFDAVTGAFLSSKNSTVNDTVGGPITASIAGKAGAVSILSGAGDVSLGVAGASGPVLLRTRGTSSVSTSEQSNSFDADGKLTGTSSSSSTASKAVGGKADMTVALGARVESLTAEGDAGATLANAGTIVGNVNLQSSRAITGQFASSSSSTTAANDKQTATTDISSSSFQEVAVGRAVSLVNSTTGLIGDPTTSVTLNGLESVTINNDGAIRGGLSATSRRSVSGDTFNGKTVTTTVFAVDDLPQVTTTVESQQFTSSSTAVGGAINARFAGTVGTTNFVPATAGNVVLNAQGNASANVVSGGAIFGNLTLSAGAFANSSTTDTTDTTTILGTDGKGSRTSARTFVSNSVREGASLASATVAGRVGFSNAGGSSNVTVSGNNASLAIDGGIVDGLVDVSANGRRVIDDKFTSSVAQSTVDSINTTTSVLETNTSKSVISGGEASLNLSAGSVGGSGSVNGVTIASATVAAPARIGSNLNVFAGVTNGETQFEAKYSRTAAGVATASQSTRTISTQVAGNATATVAGTVGSGGSGGSLTVSSSAGNATAALTGRVNGAVSVTASGTNTDSTLVDSYSGKLAASGATSYSGLGVPTVSSTLVAGATAQRTRSDVTTATGGAASLTIDTLADLRAQGVNAASSVSVGGLAGSTATIAAGSRVGGSVTVGLIAANATFNSTDTSVGTALGTQRNASSTNVSTAVGGASSLTNSGRIDGTASANSLTSAALVNNGRAGGLSATSVGSDITSGIVDTRTDNPALRLQTETTARTARLGAATITNAAGAVAGSVNIAGATGTVTNAGFITGTTTLGQSLNLGTTVIERTDGSSAFTYTAPSKRAVQTYTMDQNSIARGVTVTGATQTVSNPFTGATQTVQTSDIIATINLNSGSVTLGDITAQTDMTGARLTDTTVNLRGSGWLGAEAASITAVGVAAARTPMLSLSPAAVAEYGAAPATSVRVTGVNLLRKQDAGTFVIHGTGFVAATPPTTPAAFTLDVGTFAIDAGEVQLSRSAGTFGIRGNVTNAATLVLGRRQPVSAQDNAESLVGVGPQRIVGLTVNQTGNFTQTATGTLVVGATGALSRFTPASVGNAGAAQELLGPVSGSVSIPYFTSPALAAAGSTASRIDVTGDLNLAGTVQVVVSRDSIFRDGDGTTLATYTGAGTVTATASPTISSPFVNFRVVNDAATRTVRLVAGRSAYSAAAVGDNAKAAAAALNSAIPGITNAILTDASGGAAFSSVRSLANAQDVANVVNALDWRLTAAQAAQVFNELSSGEIYASVSAVDQNLVLNRMPAIATTALLAGEALTSRLWASPVGDFSRFNGDDTAGSTGIRSSAYGVAFGGDMAFADDGLIGIGASYGEHDVSARGTAENAQIRTWTVGAHALKGFGRAYVQGSVAYGFSRFSVERELSVLARTLGSEFRGTQLDAALEAGYRFEIGTGWNITPFAQAALRNWETNEAVEPDGAIGGGLAVRVDEASKSIFRPTLGARVNGEFGSMDGLLVRPLVNLSYTFQGDIGAARTMRFAGGGDAFTVRGFSPDGFGTIEAGIDTIVKGKMNMFVRGGYSFGGGNNAASIRAGLGFNF